MIRTITVQFTQAEYDMVMWCVRNMTDANARDINEMIACGMTKREARTLFRAEAKLVKAA